jgi:nitrite reductase/ring-hydroxylating ferredoxin subunit
VSEPAARPRVAAGSAASLANGDVRVVQLPREISGIPREALIVRDHGGVLRAYLNRCQHLPIPLDGGSRRFLSSDGGHLQCGTHGAHYRFDDGHCVRGPCLGTNLIALELEQLGDELHVVAPD